MIKVNLKFYIFFAIIAMLFIFFPQIDIAVTSLFYHNGKFNVHTPFYDLIYYGVRYLSIFFMLSLLLLLLLSFVNKTFLGLTRKKLVFILLATIIGPGLIVNVIFKDHWGRARPIHTTYFGGDKKFTPAFYKTDQCDTNCSFVSGHTAAGFLLLVFAFLYPKRRRVLFWGFFMFGVIVGYVRIAQGDHFLSDVVFSFFFVYISIYYLYRLMFNEDEANTP